VLRESQNIIKKYGNGSTFEAINRSHIEKIKIPLPPLSVQQEIVTEIEGYQKIIDGARLIVENYKPKIKIDKAWDVVELGAVCLINYKSINPEQEYGEKLFYYIDISSIENGSGKLSLNNQLKGIEAPSRAKRKISNGDVLLSTVRPNLKAFAYLTDIPKNTVASTGFAVLTSTEHILGKYVYYLLFEETVLSQMIERMGKGSYPSINQKDVEQLKIPLPPLKTQKQIVAQIEEEQKLIEANKKLMEIFEGKIKAKIAEVWG
jgi:type I restriction enzyme M protein